MTLNEDHKMIEALRRGDDTYPGNHAELFGMLAAARDEPDNRSAKHAKHASASQTLSLLMLLGTLACFLGSYFTVGFSFVATMILAVLGVLSLIIAAVLPWE